MADVSHRGGNSAFSEEIAEVDLIVTPGVDEPQVVDTVSAGTLQAPAVALDSSGESVISWSGQGSQGWGSYAHVFASDGQPVGGEIFVANSGSAGADFFDLEGSFVVASDHGMFVRVQRYSNAGDPLGNEVLLMTVNGVADTPSVAADDVTGRSAVAWSEFAPEGDSTVAYLQRFDAGGMPDDDPIELGGGMGAVSVLHPVVAMQPGGGFTAAWIEDYGEGNGRWIVVQRFDAGGVPLDGGQWIAGDVGQWFSLAANSTGEAVILWETQAVIDSSNEIRGQRMAADGSLGNDFFVAYSFDGLQHPSVALDDYGRFGAAWEVLDENGTSVGIDAVWYDTDDRVIADAARISSGAAAAQPAVATGGSGEFVITWSREATDVIVQRYALSQPPTPADDDATTPEETAVEVDVLANDSDPDGDALMVIEIDSSSAEGGQVTVDTETNLITYTPPVNFNGSDAFAYKAYDRLGGGAWATVTIDVTPVNDDPVAVSDALDINEDSPAGIDVLANDMDVDGDTLFINSYTQAANGQVSAGGGGTLVYTPNLNFADIDSFSYTVSDGKGGSATAVVTVNVTPVNDDPVAAPDSAATDEDGAIAIDVLANDSDLDNSHGDLFVSSFAQGDHGTVTLDAGSERLIYTPQENYSGDDSFSYEVSDGSGGSAEGIVSITINAVNDDPVATDDAAETDEDVAVTIDVVVNDSDVDNDHSQLTVTSFSQGENGTVALNGDGTLTYTPAPDYDGPDWFTYTISDGSGGAATGTVDLAVHDARAEIEVLAPSGAAQRIDNGEAGFSVTSGWTPYANQGYQNDITYAAAGNGMAVATWTFSNLTPGLYRVSATWHAYQNRATNSPFTVKDGDTVLETVIVNQELSPGDLSDDGTGWADLGFFDIGSSTLSVELSNAANEYVIADGVRIQRFEEIADGGTLHFGAAAPGTSNSIPLVVKNIGDEVLGLSPPSAAPAGFAGTGFSTTSLAPGETTIFQWTFTPTIGETFGGGVSFDNSDADEGPFDLTLVGVADPVVNVAIIDDGDAGFSAPYYTVFNNQGFQGDIHYRNAESGGAIATWTFTDLPPGQYLVATTWFADPNRATDSPFTVGGGVSHGATVDFNQRSDPGAFAGAFSEQGVNWAPLDDGINGGSYRLDASSTLTVSLGTSVTGFVIADAVRIEKLPEGPEIGVEEGGVNLLDGAGQVDFGTISVGVPHVRTFTVTNAGTEDLTLDGPIRVPAGFSVQSSFGATTLQPGQATTFAVQVDATAEGALAGEVSFNSNDVDESRFEFTVSADVTAAEIYVIDDGNAGFAASGFSIFTPQGLVGPDGLADIHYAQAGSGKWATWTFSNLSPGFYRVSATWFAYSNRATDSPFKVYDGAVDTSPDAAANLNQQLAPDDLQYNGVGWEDITVGLRIASGTLTVTLDNAISDATKFVIADAVRIEQVGTLIIDDHDPSPAFSAPGFTNFGTATSNPSQGYRDNIHYLQGSQPAGAATWTFTGLPEGFYRVSATWFAYGNRATDSPFKVFDGAVDTSPDAAANLNQQLVPDDLQYSGVGWEDITVGLRIASGTLTVTLDNAISDATKFVIADAVRVEHLTDPEIELIDVAGGGVAIADGDALDLGTISEATTTSHGFRVASVGWGDLNVAEVTITNVEGSAFSLSGVPATIPPLGLGEGLDLAIEIDTTVVGSYAAVVTVHSDNADEGTISFTVSARVAVAQLIDNGDAGFSASTFTSWGPEGFGGDIHYHAASGGGDAATWTFDGLSTGTYRVAVTWTAHMNRATDSPFTVGGDVDSGGTVDINQRLGPGSYDAFLANGVWWAWLDAGHDGLYTLAEEDGTITVTLGTATTGYVIADAVWLEKVD